MEERRDEGKERGRKERGGKEREMKERERKEEREGRRGGKER